MTGPHPKLHSRLKLIAMGADTLIKYLSSITKLSEPFVREAAKSFESEHYKPHQILLAPGQTESRLWFIEKGFARAYYFDSGGKEHTLNFYTINNFIFSYQGLWKETSDYYIEVLEDSEFFSVPYETISSWLDDFPEMRTLVNVIIRRRHHQDLFKSRLMIGSAEDRYQQFRKVNPEIFKKASLRLIASYLNMTRENLSRLMGREV